MDAKALAKSKRAHSQHHKSKPHPNQKLKAPVTASGNNGSKEKQAGKQVGGPGTHQARRLSKLPTNWDRYEDGSDAGSEYPSGDSTSQVSDVVVPKSKGADYRHLIAEAQSQSHSFSDFPSLDDVMPGGFIEGMGSMLSVRGEGILSWVGDDNFIVEDKTPAFEEASFLSLNLSALAEHLEKVDISQRLYVEADLLPSEAGPELSIVSSNDEPGLTQTEHESEASADISREIDITSEDLSKDEEESAAHKIKLAANISDDKAFTKIADSQSTFVVADTKSKSVVDNKYNIDATFPNQRPAFANHAKDDTTSSQYDKFGPGTALQPISQINENAVSASKNNLKFEATAAEAELDMLLDSFSDTSISSKASVSQQTSSVAPPLLSRKSPDLSKSASVSASFDDELDDLLDETSSLFNPVGFSQPLDIKVNPHETQSSSSQSVRKSQVLDDFDSWLDTI